MRRAVALFATLVLTLLLGLVAQPASAATTTTTGSITGPTIIKPGSTTTVRATLARGSTKVSGTVWLQKYASGRWTDAAPVTVRSGVGTRVIYPKGTTTYRTRYGSAVSSTFRVVVSSATYVVKGSITGPSTISAGGSTTARVTFTASGKPVTAKVWLQKYVSGRWVNAAPITVTRGVGTRVIYPKGTTTYRVYHHATRKVSPTFKVTQRSASSVPSSFTIRGSGFGHGVGMSQYGAYAQALAGRSASTILKSYYKGTAVATTTTPSTIAVQVFGPEPYGYTKGAYSDERTSTTITVTGGRWRIVGADGRSDVYGTSGSKVTMTVRSSSSKVSITVGGKSYADTRLYLHWSGTRYYDPSGVKAVATISGAQGSYRNGRFQIRPIGGKVNITNDVALNTEYLYGISEMPSSWGAKDNSALAAQAIAARSYAMTKPVKAACACNVVDDVRDQNYTGWKKQNEGTNGYYGKIWKGAVDATVTSSTRALVLTYKGKAISTHYYSSSGGRTENSEDVWASVVPFERSVDDHWSLEAPGNSMKSWTRTITQASARSLFGLSDVKTIRVSARYAGGSMAKLTATSSGGTTSSISGKSDTLRVRLGRATTTGSMPAAWVSSIG